MYAWTRLFCPYILISSFKYRYWDSVFRSRLWCTLLTAQLHHCTQSTGIDICIGVKYLCPIHFSWNLHFVKLFKLGLTTFKCRGAWQSRGLRIDFIPLTNIIASISNGALWLITLVTIFKVVNISKHIISWMLSKSVNRTFWKIFSQFVVLRNWWFQLSWIEMFVS